MNKSLLAIATATCALATLTSSAAEAGFKIHFGFGGFGGLHHHHHYFVPRYVVRPVEPKVYVARKPKPVVQDEPVTVAACTTRIRRSRSLWPTLPTASPQIQPRKTS